MAFMDKFKSGEANLNEIQIKNNEFDKSSIEKKDVPKIVSDMRDYLGIPHENNDWLKNEFKDKIDRDDLKNELPHDKINTVILEDGSVVTLPQPKLEDIDTKFNFSNDKQETTSFETGGDSTIDTEQHNNEFDKSSIEKKDVPKIVSDMRDYLGIPHENNDWLKNEFKDKIDRDDLKNELPHDKINTVILEDGSVVTLPQPKLEDIDTKFIFSNDEQEATSSETGEDSTNETEQNNDEVNSARELTEDEKNDLKEKLGWTDKQIEKCTIDENGVIHYKTDREDMEGKTGENNVPYERKIIEINGVKIEGVFPVFDSAFDVQLPKELEQDSNAKQFKECNKQLKEAIEKNPELKENFTEEQLQDIEDGYTPSGYTWHHNEEQGKMQLVKTKDHDRTQGGAAHTGGKALWGGGY